MACLLTNAGVELTFEGVAWDAPLSSQLHAKMDFEHLGNVPGIVAFTLVVCISLIASHAKADDIFVLSLFYESFFA